MRLDTIKKRQRVELDENGTGKMESHPESPASIFANGSARFTPVKMAEINFESASSTSENPAAPLTWFTLHFPFAWPLPLPLSLLLPSLSVLNSFF